MWAWFESHANGVWFRTAAPTLMSFMATLPVFLEMLAEQRRDALDLDEVGAQGVGAGVAVGDDEGAELARPAQAVDRVAGQDAVGGDGVDADRAGLAIGGGGVDERAAGPDHVVVDDH